MYLEVKQGAGGQWYVRLMGGNGEVMLFSEIYDSKGNAARAADNIQANWVTPISIRVSGNDSDDT